MKIITRIKMPLLFPMLSLLFIVLLTFTLFMSYEYSKQATADVNTFSLAKMRHSYQNTLFTFDNIRSFGVTTYQDTAISYWLISDQRDPLSDADAFNAASRFASLQPFIHSIYLVNTKTRKIIDTSTSLQDFNTFQDQGIIRKILEERPSYISYFNHMVDNVSYIGMMLPNTQSTNTGYLVILLNKDQLQKFLLQNEDTVGLQINITDKNKQLMLGESISNVELTDQYYLVPNTPFQPIEYSLGKDKRKISSAELPIEQWIMHFVVDESYLTQNIDSFKQKLAFWCVVLLILMLFLFIWSSRRTLSPFRKLSNELQNKLGLHSIQQSGADADIIRRGFTYLMDSLQDMNHSLKDYRHIAKEEFLRQWLLQGTMLEGKFHNEMSPLLSYEHLHLAILRVETYKYFVDTYNYNSRKLLKYAMGNIAQEIFSEADYTCESVDMGSDHIVLLLGAREFSEKKSEHDIKEFLENVGLQIEKWLQIRTSLALSTTLSIQDNLRQSYQDVYELSLLKFFNGENKIYCDADLEESFQQEQIYPDQSALNELIQAIKQNDAERSTALLDRLLVQLKHISYSECLFQLQMIVYSLYKAFNKVTTMKESILEEFRADRFSSLAEARAWIEQEIMSIMEALGQNQVGGRKGELVQEIIDYVQDHLQDPLLSTDLIADHLGFSSSYLRHLFKEATQVTLADFILLQRIEQVKYLLVNTEDTLAIIASKTGFQTRSHFFSAFKKATGCTPSQYRNDFIKE